jgi:flagellar motor component MotA
MATKRTELTKRIDDFLCSQLNIIMDTTRKWTIEEILEEVYTRGIEEGKNQKAEQIRTALFL